MTRRCAYCFILLLLALFYACKKEYSYEGGPGASGYCINVAPHGNFTVGKELTDSNFFLLQLEIVTKGSYNITSDTVNGFSFSASGRVVDTGATEVRLIAHGKPETPGPSLFSVRFDSSICQVQVAVLDSLSNVVQTSNNDLFPLAENNTWSYDDLSYPPDSIVNTITGIAVVSSLPHYAVSNVISFFPATNKRYYRRSDVDYFAYVPVSTFTSALDFSPTIYDDINFLKDDCQKGQTWYTPTYSGRTSLGLQVAQLRFEFRCIDDNAIVAINGKTFLQVHKIEMRPEAADVGAPLQPTGEIHTSYYARGVGLIYQEFFNTILTHPELQIKWWRVN